MPAKTQPQIPDDFYARAFNIGRAAIPLKGRPEQQAARERLLAVLDSDCPADLPEALSQLVQSRQHDINGRQIPLAKQHINRKARLLAQEIEAWLDERQHGRAA